MGNCPGSYRSDSMNWYTVKIKSNHVKIDMAVRSDSSRDALISVIKSLSEETLIHSISIKKQELFK